VIRLAEPVDVPAIVRLVRELATYERAPDQVELTDELLTAALFCQQPAAFCHVAEHDGEVVGMALWFVNFSTWVGRHGIYLEDLYVTPDHRRLGLGRALLATLAATAVERGYGRVEWAVLDWNKPAIDFYRSIDAVSMDEWTVFRVTGPALAALAEQS
jgi:GNAT superfamily N-acetyltransferase